MNGKGYKVVLILVVGLTAFSSAMKELSQIREFGLEVNQFVAEWSEKLAPAEIPSSIPPVTVARLGTCAGKQSEPAVELPWLDHVVERVAETEETADIEEPEAAPPVEKRTRIKKARPVNVDPVQFAVRILNDEVGEQDVPAVPAVSEFSFPSSAFKFKSRKHNFIKINPRDREMLKTLSRGINLRVAS